LARLTLIKGGPLFDGRTLRPWPAGAVLVEGETIVRVGPAQDLASAPCDAVIDRGRETLLPGLIDCHAHLSMDATRENYLHRLQDPIGEQTLRAVNNLRRDLLAGQTSLRCCGDKEFLDVDCRRAIEEGRLEGPSLVVATRGIKASHGHGFVGYSFDGPEQIKRAIHQNAAAGADFIKIFITGNLETPEGIPSYLSREEIELAVAEAHRIGKVTSAHCVGGPGLDWYLAAGGDVVEHAYFVSREQIERLAAGRTWVVLTPTFILEESRIRHLPPGVIEETLRQGRRAAECLAALIAGGVRFGVGSDGLHGELWRDIARLVELGASPLAALQAATSNAAELSGLGARTGTLEPGRAADLISLAGNPLADPAALGNVGAVISRGRLIFSKPPA